MCDCFTQFSGIMDLKRSCKHTFGTLLYQTPSLMSMIARTNCVNCSNFSEICSESSPFWPFASVATSLMILKIQMMGTLRFCPNSGNPE